jgi:ribosome-associated heat shock protein Hsp15
MNEQQPAGLRIDKWLWAARFFKTRGLAAEAVNGGKVHVNGRRVKPARCVRAGDQVQVQRAQESMQVIVQGISEKRGPAKEASKLYAETEESISKREEMALQRKLNAQMHPHNERKPGKRDRRHIIRFTRKQ